MVNLLKPTKIIKSKRKSISLQITFTGDFIVRAPLKYTERQISQFIKEKADWIVNKRKECFKNTIKPLDFVNNKTITLLGQVYEIQLAEIKKCKIQENKILVNKGRPAEHLVKFLKGFAKNYLEPRVTTFAYDFNFIFTGISITSAKTCWGSCSYNNRLHFTYKLMFCPKDVVDYIIIHELCHTRIKSHNAQYWDIVASCCSNYKTHEKWLKQNRGIINLI